MKRYPTTAPTAGFALAEALVALLLLAIALGGAAAALINSLAGQRMALLQTRAADLAGNLAETLRSAPDAASVTSAILLWRMAAVSELPAAQPVVFISNSPPPTAPTNGLPARVDIRLRWHGRDSSTPAQFALPLGFSALPVPGP